MAIRQMYLERLDTQSQLPALCSLGVSHHQPSASLNLQASILHRLSTVFLHLQRRNVSLKCEATTFDILVQPACIFINLRSLANRSIRTTRPVLIESMKRKRFYE